SWALFDDDGRVIRQAETGPLVEAAESARGRRVVVLVPGLEVVSTTTSLPKASHARLRKMLPYSLEEALAEDIEELFFAVGPRLESGAVAVAVVSRAKLEMWLDALDACDISPHAVYSDADGVPDTPATLTLVIENDRVYGRAPAKPAFVFEGLSLDQIVDSIGATEDGLELKHAIADVDAAGQVLYEDDLRSLAGRMSSFDVKLMADGALYRFAATVTNQPGTNLLQGRYAPKSNWGTLLRPWRTAASLLVGAVLLTLISQAAELVSLRQTDRALTTQVAESCQRNFSTPQITACETTVRSRLSDSGLLEDGSTESFLTALAAIAEYRGANSRIEALSYRNAVMDLQLV